MNYIDLYEQHGSVRTAAEAAGVSRMTFWRRLQKQRADSAAPDGFTPVQVATDGEGNLRSVKSRRVSPELYAPKEGEQVDDKAVLLDSKGHVIQRWVKPNKRPVSTDELVAACTAAAQSWPAKPPAVPPPLPSDGAGLLNVYAYGDPHIGMLAHARETGSNFDLKICTRDLVNSCRMLLTRTPAAEHALLFIAGDLWHAQDDRQATPKGGNKVDVDGRKAKILETGLTALQNMVDMILAQHQQVTIAVVPGNHDPDLALVTSIWLRALYRDTARVDVLDNANPYLPFDFGQNFFLMTHGDNRVKPQELGEIMLSDYRERVGKCKHLRAFTGHIHHKNVQEFRWGVWESFNSLCARDFWHHHAGYRSSRLVEAITFHREFGYRGRQIVNHGEL